MDDKLDDLTNAGLLDAVFDAVEDIVLVLDTGGRIRMFNPYIERVSGCVFDEVRGGDWFDIFVPEADRAASREFFLMVVDDDKSVDDAGAAGIVNRIVTKDGSLRFIEWRFGALRAERGAIVGVAFIGRDVTRRMEADQGRSESRSSDQSMTRRLETSHSLLAATLESTADGILVVDNDGKVTSFNRRFAVMWKIPERALETRDGKKLLLHVKDRLRDYDVFIKKVKELYDRPEMESYDLVEFLDGRVFERFSKPQKIGGITVGRVWSFRDATERRRAEQALTENMEMLKSIIDNSTAIIYLKDARGRYLLINRRFEELFAITNERISGLTDYDIFPRESAENLRQNDSNVMDSLTTIQSEEVVPHADGPHTYISVKFPVFNSRHNAYAVCGISTDITGRKKIELELEEKTRELSKLNKGLEKRVAQEIEKRRKKDQMLLHQSKLAAMGEMIVAISHQWRQPLNALGLLVQDVEDAYDFGELNREYIQDMVKKTMEQVHFMSRTIDDFKNFFRTSKARDEFDVALTVKEVLNILSAQLKNDFIEVEISIDADGSYVLNNLKNEFMQALLNVISNARDAILERIFKGELGKEEGRIAVTLVRRGGRLVTSVADNGGGIPDKILDRIFEPYFTSKDAGKGTGIGLYMSKTIIEKNMGGRLYAQNEGQGAVFTIELEAEG